MVKLIKRKEEGEHDVRFFGGIRIEAFRGCDKWREQIDVI